jgi:glyoxylase I family protein
MTNIVEMKARSAVQLEMPTRLHHFAYTTYNMEQTREFYEDVIGMPLTQTWIESRENPDGSISEYCHCFFSLTDGGALAFFEYAGEEPVTYADPQPAFHVALRCDSATQAGIIERLEKIAYPGIRVIDHGYCNSLYIHDPNGLRLEFTVDHPDIDAIVARQGEAARDELKRWQSGDRRPNNELRPH